MSRHKNVSGGNERSVLVMMCMIDEETCNLNDTQPPFDVHEINKLSELVCCR